MCNKIGVRFHHVCVLLSPRMCIPVILTDHSVSAGQRPHPALLWWTYSWRVEVSTIKLLTVIRSHLKFISWLKTWRHSYWNGVLSDFQSLEGHSNGCTMSEHRDLGLSEKSLHSQWDTLPSGAGRQRRDFLFFTKCNRFPDLIFCCFTVTGDVWELMCSARFPVQNIMLN